MPLVSVVRRRPLAAFAVLACAFGWLPYLLSWLGLVGAAENSPLGPALAAGVVVCCQGRDDRRRWSRAVRGWRMPWHWYAVAVAGPVVLNLVVLLVAALLGTPLPSADEWMEITGVLTGFAVMLVLVGVGEEAGWSAYAAPVLLRRYGLLGAWAVLGSLRTVWHLPLMLDGELSWALGIVGNLGFQLVLLWLLQAGARWTAPAAWHAAQNAFGGMFLFQTVTGADRDRLDLVLAGAYAVVAALLVVLEVSRRPRPGPGRRPEPGLVSTGTHGG